MTQSMMETIFASVEDSYEEAPKQLLAALQDYLDEAPDEITGGLPPLLEDGAYRKRFAISFSKMGSAPLLALSGDDWPDFCSHVLNEAADDDAYLRTMRIFCLMTETTQANVNMLAGTELDAELANARISVLRHEFLDLPRNFN